MYIGRIIGTILGWLAFRHFIGALFGFFIGLFFDRALQRTVNQYRDGADQHRIKPLFMQVLFTTLGHLAKADGRVSEAQIAHTEAIIRHLGLADEERKQAINWFRDGKKPDSYQHLLREFAGLSRRRPELRRALLEMLIQLSLLDGVIHDAEEKVLLDVASALGVPAAMFRLLLRQLQGQQQFHQQQGASQKASQLEQAYQALGVSENDSDAVIKKAYRKLISEHHPDRLIAQGAPEAVIKQATERSQVIRQAYETICEHRGNRT